MASAGPGCVASADSGCVASGAAGSSIVEIPSRPDQYRL